MHFTLIESFFVGAVVVFSIRLIPENIKSKLSTISNTKITKKTAFFAITGIFLFLLVLLIISSFNTHE